MDKHKVFLDLKLFYSKIGYIKCPALNNEFIYFNNQGFRHLLIKGRKWRKPEDQIRRLNLLKYVKSVVVSEKAGISYRVIESERKVVQFWALEMQINIDITVVVIIRQISDGRKHFFSVFSKQ